MGFTYAIDFIGTELVINALKHAFPENRHGKISIDYRSDGANWRLSVKDDGVGMPTGADKAKPGLGTGIVEALGKQMQGVLSVVDAKPGTTVIVLHDATASAGRLPTAA